MKMSSPDLFELVQSLTPSERRHFSLRIGEKDLHYGLLFRSLLEMPVFDEGSLLRELRKKGGGKNLSVAKRHLYFLLLDDLLAARSRSIEDEVRRACDHIRILRAKGLAEQARKLLRRNKKKAHEFELYRPLLDLIELEKMMLGNRSEEKELERLYREEAGCLEKLGNTNAYWRLATQIGRLQRQYQKMPGEAQQKALDALNRDPLLSQLDQATTLQSKIYFLRAKSTYYFTVGQPEEAYLLNEQLLHLLENSPSFLKQFPEIYLHTFNNFLIDSLLLQRFEALALGLEKLSSLSGKPAFRQIKDLEAQLFRQRYLLEINWQLSTGNIEKAVALISGIERGLERFGARLLKPHRVTLEYLLAYLSLLDGRHDRSAHWISRLLQEKEDVVLEVFQFTRILNLLLHFDLGNWEHLSYLILSTRRYLRQRRALYRTETALLQFLQRSINLPAAERRLLRQAFVQEVGALAEHPEEKRFFNYIDLKVWVGNEV